MTRIFSFKHNGTIHTLNWRDSLFNINNCVYVKHGKIEKNIVDVEKVYVTKSIVKQYNLHASEYKLKSFNYDAPVENIKFYTGKGQVGLNNLKSIGVDMNKSVHKGLYLTVNKTLAKQYAIRRFISDYNQEFKRKYPNIPDWTTNVLTLKFNTDEYLLPDEDYVISYVSKLVRNREEVKKIYVKWLNFSGGIGLRELHNIGYTEL